MKRKSGSRVPYTRRRVKMSTEEFADKLRDNMTRSELTLWKFLKKEMVKWGVRFEPQAVICGFIPDFYCDDVKLAVEVDGPIHLKKSVRARDARKTRILYKAGIRTIRFSNHQVLFRTKDVIRAIEFVVRQLARQ